MSLASKILDTLTRKKTGKKSAYLAALRGGKSADEIAAAADAAGIPPDQIQRDADALDKAAELRATVDNLPTLKKAAADAKRILDGAARALDDAIAKLQPAVDAAALDVQEADKVEREGRAAMAALAGLYAERGDLLDKDKAPPALQELWRAEANQARADAIGSAKAGRIHAAKERVRGLENLIHALTYSHPFDPHPLIGERGGMFDPNTLPADKAAAIAQAQMEFAKATAALAAIEAQ